MKKFVLFCGLALVLAVQIFAQSTERDSVQAPPLIRKIVFDGSFRSDTISVDTSVFRLHVLNPATNISPWFSYLTRSAYPVEWLQFTQRGQVRDPFYPSWYIVPYITLADDNYFFQTRRQFSDLSYTTSGGDDNNEEHLHVLHTQNITRRSNIGLNFDMNGSLLKIGFTSRFENASDNALNLFYRYSGERYKGFYRFYLNSVKLNETGGLLNDSLLRYGTNDVYGLDVRLNGARSHFRKTGFLMSHQIDISKSYEIVNPDSASKDSLIRRKRTYGSLMYVFNIESNKRTYIERQPETLFYNNFYARGGISNGSIVMHKISNRFLLQSPFIVKYLPDLAVSLNNDIYVARFGMDTTFVPDTFNLNPRKGNFQQTWISANARQKFGYIDWDFSLNSYMLGYGIGDQEIKVRANLYANKSKTMALSLLASSSLKSPSFMLTKYFSNHLIFNNDFNREKRQELSGTLRIGGKALELTGSYILLNDFLYFNTEAKPAQAPQLNIVSGEASSDLSFWKFQMLNRAVLQETDGDQYVHIPRWMFFHSMNFQHTFLFRNTGGKLFMQLGYDLTYTSSFKAANYMPATGVFFLQNEKEIGNYAKLDVHLTMKVKTVSFFLKLSHVNSAYTTRQFTALHYPMMPMLFSYGINWLFYD